MTFKTKAVLSNTGKNILIFLSFWFEPEVSWRIFMLFWVLWAANMLKLLVPFSNPSHWVNYSSKNYPTKNVFLPRNSPVLIPCAIFGNACKCEQIIVLEDSMDQSICFSMAFISFVSFCGIHLSHAHAWEYQRFPWVFP